MKKLMIAAICLCGLMAVAAQAATFDGVAVKDTSIITDAPDRNLGHDGRLQVADQGAEAGSDRRALIQFDLPGDLTDGTVNSATLSFDSWYGASQTVNVLGMAHEWTEGTGDYVNGYVNTESGASWNSYEGMDAGDAPWPGGAGALGDTIGPGTAYGSVVVSSKGETPATATTYSVDITGFVQLWADGTANYGLMLEEASYSNGHKYGSKDLTGYDEGRGVTWCPPSLSIDYNPIPEPSVIALLLAGVAALALLRRK